MAIFCWLFIPIPFTAIVAYRTHCRVTYYILNNNKTLPAIDFSSPINPRP